MVKYLLILLLLCVSCSQPLPTNQRVQTLSEGGDPCNYEGQFNYISLQIHWDELYGWVVPEMVDNANFWGDSAIVLLNQIKHNESTLTCVPALTFDLATAYTDTLTAPPHQGGFGNQYTINIDFAGDYSPTSAEMDSVVHLCNNAIWWLNRIKNDVHNRWHWYYLQAYDYSYSGGF